MGNFCCVTSPAKVRTVHKNIELLKLYSNHVRDREFMQSKKKSIKALLDSFYNNPSCILSGSTITLYNKSWLMRQRLTAHIRLFNEYFPEECVDEAKYVGDTCKVLLPMLNAL